MDSTKIQNVDELDWDSDALLEGIKKADRAFKTISAINKTLDLMEERPQMQKVLFKGVNDLTSFAIDTFDDERALEDLIYKAPLAVRFFQSTGFGKEAIKFVSHSIISGLLTKNMLHDLKADPKGVFAMVRSYTF